MASDLGTWVEAYLAASLAVTAFHMAALVGGIRPLAVAYHDPSWVAAFPYPLVVAYPYPLEPYLQWWRRKMK